MEHMWHESRFGTKITNEEREKLESDISLNNQRMNDRQWLEKDCESWRDLCGVWDISWTVQAMQMDNLLMERILKTGIIE